jgi:hypothetical protein
MKNKLYVIKWEEDRYYSSELNGVFYFVDWTKNEINNKEKEYHGEEQIYIEFPFSEDNVDSKLLKKSKSVNNAFFMDYEEAIQKYDELKKLSFIPKKITIEYTGSKITNRFELMDI